MTPVRAVAFARFNSSFLRFSCLVNSLRPDARSPRFVALLAALVIVAVALSGCSNSQSGSERAVRDVSESDAGTDTPPADATPADPAPIDPMSSHVNDDPIGKSVSPAILPTSSARALYDSACGNQLSVTSPGPLAPDLTSVSGLAASARHENILWAVEDSFEPSELVALNLDGTTHHKVTIHAGLIANIDWEDIATWTTPDGIPMVYIADTGDNLLIRDTLRLLVLSEPDLDMTQATADIVHLRFPDDHRANVEAIIVDDDGLWLFDKPHERDTTTVTTVWHSTHDALATGDVTLESVFELPTGTDAVTAADRSASGDLVVIRTLGAVHIYPAQQSNTGSNTNLLDVLTSNACQAPPPPEKQGESIAISRDGTSIFTVSEDESGGVVDLHQISVHT